MLVDFLSITPLSYALMGSLLDGPKSGYAIRRLFERTGMGNFSSSPGSIYPALNKLKRMGLVAQKADGGKPLFQLSQEGRRVLRRWLKQPVTPEEVGNEIHVSMLRFELSGKVANPELTERFLVSFESASRAFADAMKTAMLQVGDKLNDRLALQHKMLSAETSALWAAHALREVRKLEPADAMDGASDSVN